LYNFFLFLRKKIIEKNVNISVSKKKDFKNESLSSLFVRGFNESDYLCNLALINLIKLYCYENKIVLSTLNQPLLTDILYNTFTLKTAKNDTHTSNSDLENSSNTLIKKERQIIYLQDLQKLLEHIIYSIRTEYPQKFSGQICVDRLEKLIEQYCNLAARIIIANPSLYLPFETEVI
jgi:hypothetical protein